MRMNRLDEHAWCLDLVRSIHSIAWTGLMVTQMILATSTMIFGNGMIFQPATVGSSVPLHEFCLCEN
jgi:hypothetical protein